jgi:hypothetical protein
MAIATINPAMGQVLKTFEPLSDAQLELKQLKLQNADGGKRRADEARFHRAAIGLAH